MTVALRHQMPWYCARCASTNRIAVYDHDGERVPLCPEHAPAFYPIISADDLPAILKVSHLVCWCDLAEIGLRVVRCPACGLKEPPQAQWQPYRKE